MKKKVVLVWVGLVLLSIFLKGCTITGAPRTRLASYATATVGTAYIDSNSLGGHNYGNFMGEGNGIVYTCRGGHIDVAHLRIASDYVDYLYRKVKRNILKGNQGFTFKLNVEASRYHVDLKYPEDWENYPKDKKEEIADEVSVELASYFAYTMTTWHEMLTWYGFKCLGFWPEDASAFSWEDIYSNLLGVILGAEAVQRKDYSFNEAMTIVLKERLEQLGGRPASVSRQAAEKMRGKWYGGTVFVSISERNTDIGLDDGMVTPTLVPGICENAEPELLPVPKIDKLKEYDFVMDLVIEPREFEKGKILRLIYPQGDGKLVIPEKHFTIIMEDIRKNALKQGYTIFPDNQ